MIKKEKAKATLEYSSGSGSGKAIYLCVYDKTGKHLDGTRVAGGKCWGYVTAEKTFVLDAKDLESLIKTAKSALEQLKKQEKILEEQKT